MVQNSKFKFNGLITGLALLAPVSFTPTVSCGFDCTVF
jgi:hypothetical protein